MTSMLEHLQRLNRGDQISIILAGIIVNGTYEELVDDCVVLTDATSPVIKKEHYTLKIPLESIYAWGRKERKEKEKKEKKKKKDE